MRARNGPRTTPPRFAFPRQSSEGGLCIADFVRDVDAGERDVIGLQAVTVGAEKIGISLTDEWQLDPEQSTSAIVILHPQAKYFTI